MTFKSLKRNSGVIVKKITLKDNILVAKENLKIVFPARYINRELASFENGVSVLGIWMWVDEDNNYSLSNVPGMVSLTPNNITTEIIDNKEYYICEFEKGSIISPHYRVLQVENIMYILYDEFIVKGNVPEFFNYGEVSKISDNAGKYTGSALTKYKAAFELLESIVAKDPNDPNSYYRTSEAFDKQNPEYVGLSNVFRSIPGTLSKISGSYFDNGLLTAVTTPENEQTKLEQILLS